MKLSTAEPSYYQRNKDKYKGYREKNRENKRNTYKLYILATA